MWVNRHSIRDQPCSYLICFAGILCSNRIYFFTREDWRYQRGYTTGVTSGTGIAYHSWAPPVFSGVRVNLFLVVLYVCLVDRCCPFVLFSAIVLSVFSIYGFWLPLWYLQTLLTTHLFSRQNKSDYFRILGINCDFCSFSFFYLYSVLDIFFFKGKTYLTKSQNIDKHLVNVFL